MKSAQSLMAVGLFAVMLLLSGCGFRPIYATTADGVPPLNQRIAIRNITAPETVRPLIEKAFQDRLLLREGQSPEYELHVTARESAERLAVQIDATVTRYNYRLRANYTLVDLKTGKSRKGSAQSVTSYNIVSSQYSTLYAERTAQEKASRLLAEEIERDLLIQFIEAAEEGAEENADEATADDAEVIDFIEESESNELDSGVIRIDNGTN